MGEQPAGPEIPELNTGRGAAAGPFGSVPGRGAGRPGSARHGTARPAPCQSLSQRRRLMEPHGPACPGSVLFGCELSASTKSYTFQVDEEDNSDHILALSVVSLTDGAKDECNVVEVVGRNHENQEIAVPVANLKLSCQPLLSLDNFKLQPPVTFRLAAGSGPVHLAGWHRIMHREDVSFEEDDDLSEEDEEDLPPIMPAKK
ncbi:nucleoplasmin-3 [Passer montanus]|uniref:nucleoplasmin-3 n=2 Tax=Passer TaxID=9159 RepID=UPI00195F3E82|nr:nucleoplasmin-3 [Passer montanus]